MRYKNGFFFFLFSIVFYGVNLMSIAKLHDYLALRAITHKIKGFKIPWYHQMVMSIVHFLYVNHKNISCNILALYSRVFIKPHLCIHQPYHLINGQDYIDWPIQIWRSHLFFQPVNVLLYNACFEVRWRSYAHIIPIDYDHTYPDDYTVECQ